MSSGKFQGMMAPTTPIGSRRMYVWKLPNDGVPTAPSIFVTQPA